MVHILETWSLLPGMKTAKAVYQGEQLLLREGTSLTPSIIQRLNTRGIRRIAVFELEDGNPLQAAVPPLPVPSFFHRARLVTEPGVVM